MPITLTSRLLSGPLIVPLSSGGSVRLSPGQSSPELADVEAAANPALAKLVERGLVEVQQQEEQGQAARPGRRRTPSRSRASRPTGEAAAEPPDDQQDAPFEQPATGAP
jgi:hypothetical protein